MVQCVTVNNVLPFRKDGVRRKLCLLHIIQYFIISAYTKVSCTLLSKLFRLILELVDFHQFMT